MAKTPTRSYSNDQIREMILQYFYNRNKNATSRKGKKGSHVKISDVRSDLKDLHGFKATEVVGHINYLISQGWLDIDVEKKSFTTDRGVTIPSETEWYFITAPGIDKIEGPSSFTRDRFTGIKIEATGQNIITLGDGNQVNVKYQDAGKAPSDLREAVKRSHELRDEAKLEIVSDIDTISSQLTKPEPNKTVIASVRDGINKAASVGSLVDLVTKVSPVISSLFS
ncbi:MAG TPA: hypothetical protein VK589_02220 [Chryseolinea sp.]|nr:hypothetical protein [Chryseolinea sp.]